MTAPAEATRRQLIVGVLAFFVVGLAAATYLHWPALTDELVYKSDVRQSPHWMAFHGTSFVDDDLLVEYGNFNESPIQNAIYWLGTWFVDPVWLTKIVAVVTYGLCSALFFFLGSKMLGLRGGALTATFFTFFPDQFDYFAGGFSKLWMIPLLLLAVYVVEKRSWRNLVWLMPFAALAYPMATVLIGATIVAALALQVRSEKQDTILGLKWLSAASAVALVPLLIKYASPAPNIGPATSGAVLRTMPEMYKGGFSPYLPTPPLWESVVDLVSHPFLLYGAVILFVVLKGRGIGWKRSWSARLLASAVLYVLADVFFMRLYMPNRYIRYSMGLLFALWQGHNLDLVLDRIPRRGLRVALMVLVFGVGAVLFQDTFRQGKDTMDRNKRAALCEFLATQPEKSLVTGHPRYMDDIPVQARRSVLTNYKMFHSWFTTYHAEMDRRTRDTFRALYATGPGPINHLAEEYGVTHLVVVRKYFNRRRIKEHDVYQAPFNEFIEELAHDTVKIRGARFFLENPPKESVLYSDNHLQILALPLSVE